MRLPPLNALRAFEAAARHQSFARAADELHVTQGAISRHVKLLEEHLGVTLFRRRPQGVALSEQARILLPEITAAFERIGRAARRVADADRELRVASAPTLAARWLVRRLVHFQELHPEIRVTLGVMCPYDDFFRGGFDLGIVDYEMQREQPEGLEAVLLRREALAPVCAPSLLERPPALRQRADLAKHVLLHPTRDRCDWRKWLRGAGLPAELVEGGQVYGTMEMAISAAMGGLGIAIADLDLIRDELAMGKLVAPLELVVRDETGYFLFAEQGRFAEPKIAAFRTWLQAEVAGDTPSRRRAA